MGAPLAPFAKGILPTLRFGEAHGARTSTRVFVAYADLGGGSHFTAAALAVDEKLGTVELAFTQDGFRRLGLASALLAVAREKTGSPLDKDTGQRSTSGGAWLKANGATLAPRKGFSDEEAEGKGNGLMTGLFGVDFEELPAPGGWTAGGYQAPGAG